MINIPWSLAGGIFTLFATLIAIDYYTDKDIVRIILFVANSLSIIWMIHTLRQTRKLAVQLHDRAHETDLSYRAVVELSPHLIWYANQYGELTYVNNTALEYTGLSMNQLTGGQWISCLHPDDQVGVVEKWKRFVESREDYETEYRIRRSDGNFRWFEVNAKAIYKPNGEFDRWIGQCSDSHDRKMAMTAHENAIFARDRFMSLASHELRTPLTSIKLQMQILNRQIKKKDMSLLEFGHLADIATLALKQVDQLDHLIEEMLDVSRISSGKMTFTFTECCLENLIRQAVSIVSVHYGNARVPLDLVIDPDLKVTCDENKMSQVVINLLTNALKYGGGNPVQLIAKREKDVAKIEVIDMGIGVPLDSQKRIFEPFERVDSKSPISGLGLGLYISREVIHAHKGKIGLVSRPKKGSKFIIEIPLVQNQMTFFERPV